MSLLNPATAYRRSTNRPRVPVVLPLVHADVDGHGRLAVTVDDVPFRGLGSGEEPTLSRAELRPLLDRIASERGSALRVEIHEPDGTVFTDFHTHGPAPVDTPPTPSTVRDAPPRRPTLSARVGSGEVTGTGFASGEEIAIAVVIFRHQAKADGTIELNLPIALLEGHQPDVVVVGATSGSVNATANEASEPVSEAS